jgi:hypothetical protein
VHFKIYIVPSEVSNPSFVNGSFPVTYSTPVTVSFTVEAKYSDAVEGMLSLIAVFSCVVGNTSVLAVLVCSLRISFLLEEQEILRIQKNTIMKKTQNIFREQVSQQNFNISIYQPVVIFLPSQRSLCSELCPDSISTT